MKKVLLYFLLLILSATLFFSFAKKPISKTINSFEPIAVVELFTSQGCSSCPSADKLLGKTILKAEREHKKIFALSYHVDYWNRLGWIDPFSSEIFSKRQADYVSVLNASGAYTPQIIVNGGNEFVGSNETALTQSLYNALHTETSANFTLLSTTINNSKLLVKYAVEGNIDVSTINIALITAKETTVIKRGENEGYTLVNENVVRQLITEKASKDGEIEITSQVGSSNNNTAIIAFIQQKNDYKIIAAASQKIKTGE
jgi:hypothetical protein